MDKYNEFDSYNIMKFPDEFGVSNHEGFINHLSDWDSQ